VIGRNVNDEDGVRAPAAAPATELALVLLRLIDDVAPVGSEDEDVLGFARLEWINLEDAVGVLELVVDVVPEIRGRAADEDAEGEHDDEQDLEDLPLPAGPLAVAAELDRGSFLLFHA
jgi:hypothetical protein